MSENILNDLYKTLQARKNADPAESYVAQLYQKGTEKIARKVVEEATETLIEAIKLDTDNSETTRNALKNESADLLFHLLTLLSHHDIEPNEIFEILGSRIGTSGLEEKASRKAK